MDLDNSEVNLLAEKSSSSDTRGDCKLPPEARGVRSARDLKWGQVEVGLGLESSLNCCKEDKHLLVFLSESAQTSSD